MGLLTESELGLNLLKEIHEFLLQIPNDFSKNKEETLTPYAQNYFCDLNKTQHQYQEIFR